MTTESTPTQGKPRVVDVQTWRAALADQRRREKGRGVEQLSHTFPLIDILPWAARRNGSIHPKDGRRDRPTRDG